MGWIQEFKDFAMKGNMVDLAVGVVIGGAFGKIVTSLVGDIMMPLLSLLTGSVNLTQHQWIIRAASTKPNGAPIEAVSIHYGNFLQQSLDFFLIAFSIFLVVKAMNQLRQPKASPEPAKEETPAQPPQDIVLLSEIRDLLRQHTASPN